MTGQGLSDEAFTAVLSFVRLCVISHQTSAESSCSCIKR